MSVAMKASDTLFASEAECFLTVSGNRYNVMNAVNLEAKFEKTKKEVPILGKTIQGNKACGGKGTGKMTLHYVSSLFRKMMIDYIHTGKDVYFEIQCTNEDPSSAVGRQTITLKDCNLNSVILAKFAAGSDILDEDVDFTYEDADMPEEFTELAGMQA